MGKTCKLHRVLSSAATAVLIPTLLLWLQTSLPTSAHGQQARSDLMDYAVSTLKNWEIPGLSLAIVKEDSFHVMMGFGVKEAVTNDPVDSRTHSSLLPPSPKVSPLPLWPCLLNRAGSVGTTK